jgi:hypothetical protein
MNGIGVSAGGGMSPISALMITSDLPFSVRSKPHGQSKVLDVSRGKKARANDYQKGGRT